MSGLTAPHITACLRDEEFRDVLIGVRRRVHDPVRLPALALVPELSAAGKVQGRRPDQTLPMRFKFTAEVSQLLLGDPGMAQ